MMQHKKRTSIVSGVVKVTSGSLHVSTLCTSTSAVLAAKYLLTTAMISPYSSINPVI